MSDISLTIEKGIKEFKDHCAICHPERIAAITATGTEEQKQVESRLAELELEFVDLVEKFNKANQNLTALVLMNILGLTHNREEQSLQAVGLYIELRKTGRLEGLLASSENSMFPAGHC